MMNYVALLLLPGLGTGSGVVTTTVLLFHILQQNKGDVQHKPQPLNWATKDCNLDHNLAYSLEPQTKRRILLNAT